MENTTRTKILNSNEEWVNYLTKALDLDANDADMLTHDLNNLRADEWLDTMRDYKLSANMIKHFKEFFNIS
mgnify:CR=1 FL=1